MAPYEALYGRPCRSPIYWTEMGERSIIGPNLIRDTSEKVDLIRKHLLMAQSKQKNYADRRRRPPEFEVGDHVFLKVIPKRGVLRFNKHQGILGPSRYSRGWDQLLIGWRYHRVYQVSMRCSTSPCSRSILQIQLM